MRPLVALVPLLLATGCLAAFGEEVDTCVAPEVTMLPQGVAARAAGEPLHVLHWIEPPANVTGELRVLVTPGNATSAEVPASANDVGIAFGGTLLTPDGDATAMRFVGEAGTCMAELTLPLAPPVDGPRVEPGQGVLVHTAGFWTNGTTFYTNHAGVDNDSLIPKGYLGPFDGAPLAVYVYEEEASERPRRYEQGGYSPTIRGFNEALKGIAVGAPRLVVIPPEDAYTAPGREAHPLYGETLVFWIEAVAIHDLPCPLPQPTCDLPGTPRPPSIPPPGFA